jgi:hypothetical protein
LQGCFADRLRDGDSNAISWLWRNGLLQIPCVEEAGNFSAAAGNFFAATGKDSIPPGLAAVLAIVSEPSALLVTDAVINRSR